MLRSSHDLHLDSTIRHVMASTDFGRISNSNVNSMPGKSCHLGNFMEKNCLPFRKSFYAQTLSIIEVLEQSTNFFLKDELLKFECKQKYVAHVEYTFSICLAWCIQNPKIYEFIQIYIQRANVLIKLFTADNQPYQ